MTQLSTYLWYNYHNSVYLSVANMEGITFCVTRGGSLVDFTNFVRREVGSNLNALIPYCVGSTSIHPPIPIVLQPIVRHPHSPRADPPIQPLIPYCSPVY